MKINPEFVDAGIFLCTKKCEAWQKDSPIVDGKPEIVIRCKEDQYREVVPRPVCLPWIRSLQEANKTCSASLQRAVTKTKEMETAYEDQLQKKRAVIKRHEKEGLKVRAEMMRLRGTTQKQKDEIDILTNEVMTSSLNIQHAWADLKELQDFRKQWGRVEKKVARLEKKEIRLQEVETELKQLKIENAQLKQEDRAKQARLAGLTERLKELAKEKKESPDTAEKNEAVGCAL